jgi:hypothetical protein
MHAPARADLSLHRTWRHPNGDGYHYFDSVYAGELIRRFNQSAEVSAVNQLLDHCEPLADPE